MSADTIDYSKKDEVFSILWNIITSKKVTKIIPNPPSFPDGPVDWNEVQTILDNIPAKDRLEIASRQGRDSVHGVVVVTHTILHAACCRQPTNNIVDTLIKFNSAAIYTQNKVKMIPFHSAC